jgi:hypothetical protein
MEAHQLTALKVPYLCFPPLNLLVAATVVVEHSQERLLDRVTQVVLGAAAAQVR